MKVRAIVLGFALLGAGGGLLARGATRIGVHQGYAPEQPIGLVALPLAEEQIGELEVHDEEAIVLGDRRAELDDRVLNQPIISHNACLAASSRSALSPKVMRCVDVSARGSFQPRSMSWS